MTDHNEFIEYLLEMLEPLGSVRAKAMFGGYGIYHGEYMFGLVADDIFYLKVDDENRPDFKKAGVNPFIYRSKGRDIKMSYYEVPPEAMDDSDDLCKWAKKAYQAAIRSARKKK